MPVTSRKVNKISFLQAEGVLWVSSKTGFGVVIVRLLRVHISNAPFLVPTEAIFVRMRHHLVRMFSCFSYLQMLFLFYWVHLLLYFQYLLVLERTHAPRRPCSHSHGKSHAKSYIPSIGPKGENLDVFRPKEMYYHTW